MIQSAVFRPPPLSVYKRQVRRFARSVLPCIAVWLAGERPAAGQQIKFDPPPGPKNLRMQTVLYEAEQLALGKAGLGAEAVPAAQLQKYLKDRYITLDDQGL